MLFILHEIMNQVANYAYNSNKLFGMKYGITGKLRLSGIMHYFNGLKHKTDGPAHIY